MPIASSAAATSPVDTSNWSFDGGVQVARGETSVRLLGDFTNTQFVDCYDFWYDDNLSGEDGFIAECSVALVPSGLPMTIEPKDVHKLIRVFDSSYWGEPCIDYPNSYHPTLPAKTRYLDCVTDIDERVPPGSYRVALVIPQCSGNPDSCGTAWRYYQTYTMVSNVNITTIASTKYTLRANPNTGSVRAGTPVKLTLYSASTWTDGAVTTASAATKACSRVQFRSSSKALWKDVASSTHCQAKVWPYVSGQWRFVLRNGTPLEAVQIRVK